MSNKSVPPTANPLDDVVTELKALRLEIAALHRTIIERATPVYIVNTERAVSASDTDGVRSLLDSLSQRAERAFQ